jgi:hypothetical protein
MLVVRIFTDKSISPSLSLRQRPDRYAFRAGRNLLDNEFRSVNLSSFDSRAPSFGRKRGFRL